MYVASLLLFSFFRLKIKLTGRQPWGEGPNDLDLDRYCNLLALDLEEIVSTKLPTDGWFGAQTSACNTPGSATPKVDDNARLAVTKQHFGDLEYV
tara:strand:+ start:1478 stop:1762 length:285 start_codon:yes stop_codon:yes gene_type:complete